MPYPFDDEEEDISEWLREAWTESRQDGLANELKADCTNIQSPSSDVTCEGHSIDEFIPPTAEMIQERARKAHLEHVFPYIPDSLWPSIRLLPTAAIEDAIALGTSKLGGLPDLPAEEVWPQYEGAPMAFLAQINLSEVAKVHRFKELPADGLLSFFYDLDLGSWGDESVTDLPKPWKVLYLPSGTPLLRRQAPDDLYEDLQFEAKAVRLLEEATFSSTGVKLPTGFNFEDAKMVEAVSLADEEMSELREFFGERDTLPKHRMMGYPEEYQTDTYAEVPDSDRLRLLLQLDTDYVDTPEGEVGMVWGAGGRIYFWIDVADLCALNFDNVTFSLQCT